MIEKRHFFEKCHFSITTLPQSAAPFCTPKRLGRARDALDIWPPFPLIIPDCNFDHVEPSIADNIIAALEHNDRVCHINLTM
jgi:hypothetical protein